jgi:ACR3 family arsenite efflux pump ArsB
VLIGVLVPDTGTAFEALMYPVLAALLYATFLQVPFTALREAFTDRRFLLAAHARSRPPPSLPARP